MHLLLLPARRRYHRGAARRARGALAALAGAAAALLLTLAFAAVAGAEGTGGTGGAAPAPGGSPEGGAPPATSEATLIVNGAGDGHGVGMSQDGALGYARHGYSYAQILAHYYTATALGQAKSGAHVRVLLAGNRTRMAFSGAARAGRRRLNPHAIYTVSFTRSGRIELRGPKRLALTVPSLTVTGSHALTLIGSAENGVRNGAYRGALEFAPAQHGGMNTIDVLRLEQYVRGTISGEMPSSWPPAALQAQAVACRTYALTSHANANFDLYADTRSQMYRGVSAETPATDAAASTTAGQIVTYQGRPAITYFFASSGGATENIENSFPGAEPQPWLKGVPDPYDAGPLHTWSLSMSFAEAQHRLGSLVQGTLEGIEVLRRGYSPRIVSADVLGSRGRTQVSGPQLAAALALYDTWAYFSVRTPSGTTPEPDQSGKPPGGAPGEPPAETPAPESSGGVAASR